MRRVLAIVLLLCTIFSAVVLFRTNSRALKDTESMKRTVNNIVSLDGKKIMIVGNSMAYYGNCVIFGNQGEKDEGYFYQLIKQNGENATVIDHTYSGKKLDYIYEHYISKLSESERDVDYLVLSEGNQYNDNLLGTVEKYLKLFPKDTEFRFLRQPMMFESDLTCLLEGVKDLRDNGYIVVDWGQLVYDIYHNGKSVPNSTLTFNRESFMKENLGYKNGKGKVHGSGNRGDRNHENLLSGYITAQMLYSSITNRPAVNTDCSFCYDTSIHPYFDIDTFAMVHYTDPLHPTNFNEIFRSEKDMLGLQLLIDEYLKK